LIQHPKILGVYSWSRGGGWYGPYIQNELWPDLNAFVLARFVKDPARTEEEIFLEYATARLGLENGDVNRFRELCLLSARAVLKGRHCAVFDRELKESVLPTACWMRDDRLGGRHQLAAVLDYLNKNNLGPAALAEKNEAVQLWEKINALAGEIHWPASATGEFAKISAAYGLRLFRIVEQGWRVLLAGHRAETTGRLDEAELEAALAGYDSAWTEYRALAASPLCPSLYEGRYFGLPGKNAEPGLDASVAHFRKLLFVPALK
jgi:hypothetical protein